MKRTIFTLALAFGVTCTLAQKKSAPVPSQDWMDKALQAKEATTKTPAEGLPYVSKTYKYGDQPGSIDVGLEGLDELVLMTWATKDGNDFDHATWANAVLIDKNGKEHRLDQEDYKVKKIAGDWFRLTTNFSGKPLSIGNKSYEHGVIAHADGLLVVNLKGRNMVRFKSDIGIDKGSSGGSVVFKVLPTSGIEEGKELARSIPQTNEIFTTFGISPSDWITTPGMEAEKSALNSIATRLNNRNYFDGEMAKLDALKSPKEQLKGYLGLVRKANEVLSVQTQLEWLNVPAVKLAFADFSKGAGYDKAKYQAKLDELVKITADGLKGVYSLEPEAVARAAKALELKRDILMSNPALDFDKIIATKYRLGGNARFAGGQDLGMPNSNWSSLMSTRRNGYDAEIVEFSGLRGADVTERSVFKPENDGLISEVDLHWDASKMLFTAQNEQRQLQLYEVNTDGTGYKQLTKLPETDVEFFDAAYLPSGKIVTASNIAYNGVPCIDGEDPVSTYSLYDPKTNELRRLTFDQDCNWNATVLQNGKVMYTRWEYTDLMHYYSRIIFTMNPDGTEQKAHFGSGAMFPNSTFSIQQLPENQNRFIGVITGHHGTVRSGRLIIFDPTKARKGVEGMIQELPFKDREIIPVVKDYLVDGVWPQFLTPFPVTDNYFLVTAKLSPNSLWGIYLVDVFDNLTLIKEIEGDAIVNPIPVKKRPVPVEIPEKVPMNLAGAPTDATVFIQDVYEGEGLPNVPRGTIKEFRVLAYDFAYLNSPSNHMNNGIQAGWDIKRELGRVPVNPDGSAIFTIPANTPISLQPLDSNGTAVQLMRSWFVGMPGETVSCVGCHEDQNKIAKPVRTMASRQKPSAIVAPEGGIRPFTFENEIQPILDRACIACHNGEKLAGGIDYTKGRIRSMPDYYGERKFSESYLSFHPYFYRQGPEAEMAVLNPYEYHVDNSEMIQMLRKGHNGVELTDKEWNRLITWVDFNLPYGGVFDANPYKSKDGVTYDQKKRRIELTEKYANAPIKWEEELNNFQSYLAAQPDIEPTMPKTTDAKAKELKLKNWPFTAEQAREMVKGKEPKVVDLGNGTSITFVYIPAGTYIAGGSGKNGQLSQRKEVVKKGFWMADKEISNEQMRALAPTHSSRYIGQQWKDHTNPGYFVDSNHYAATKISYNDAMNFNQLLSKKTGMNVTLPTEAQWEWAARAGSGEAFWFGSANTDFTKYENMADKQLDKMAVSGVDPQPMNEGDLWFALQAYIPKDRSLNDGHMLMTAPGQYQENPWGLYDINGNVAEWTRTAGEGQNYVVKGGSWYDRAKKATAADRRQFLPWHQVWNVGFRPIIEE